MKGKIIIDNNKLLQLLWEERPFSKLQAWIYLVIHAAQMKKKKVYREHIYIIEKGQLITSDSLLSREWGWSRNKVRDFIKMLMQYSYITVRRDKRGTHITIINYDTYIISEITESITVFNKENYQKVQEKEQAKDQKIKKIHFQEEQEKVQEKEQAKSNKVAQKSLFPDEPLTMKDNYKFENNASNKALEAY